MLLEVNNLKLEVSNSEGNRPLLKGLNFGINKGEILALVGGSGSGKSLTALTIMRLLAPSLQVSQGEILLDGLNLFALTEMQMNAVRGEQIAMIFQEPQTALNPVKTIGEQIGEALQWHKKTKGAALKERVLSLLKEVDMPNPEQRIDWYPHQLSGGQKQRVVIAIALACEPKLLIADEPTTALDVTIQKQILALLNNIRKTRDLAVLLITHDFGVVNEMADRVAVMRYGAIVEQAPAAEFFANPQHEYSRELLASLPSQDFRSAIEPTPLLQVKDLKVWFAQRAGILQRVKDYTKAVDGISFEIGKGETLALVGESGSGKSTVGRGILSLEPLAGGEIYYQGERIDGLSRKAFLPYRKKIQVIFQDPFSSMNPRFTVRDILLEGMQALQIGSDDIEREQRMKALLERVGMRGEHLYRYPHEFSGGQRQRIAIARALAVEPELIICDEPTSALDLAVRGQVLELLEELQQELGLSYLFITHDLAVIPQLAHRVAVMKEGKVVEQGSTEQVLSNPQHEYTQRLLAAVPAFIQRAQ